MVREGHYTFSDTYKMPAYLRKFFIRSISEENRKNREEMDKRSGREDLSTKKISGKKYKETKKKSLPSKPYITKAPTK